ncbi:DNA-binding transcriptional LysR family regulator [Litoreibacter meonggei]|uniref:DNA-binding transcriptional LysR family regulator n=1 Tax=Litoreibacter meonggei TaxID=1049199 RepID=A0A497VHE9_9RHOB|nr:LysR family transcriptional regulator [Litoreibacter meonggei]RLJ41667.1 DNA-binding transcriptional LysR family regulator [Litoreibacter meonggei]
MHRFNWDDLKYILAVADSGSVSKAGRLLQVNHATVLRRVTLFEERFGLSVFDRTPQGYRLPKENEHLIETIREVDHSVRSVERLIEGGKAPLSGRVRITSTDTLCHSVLPSIVSDMQADSDGLTLELISTNAHLDMTRLDADITVRPTAQLPDHLIGERAGELVFGVYGPARPSEMGDTDWLGLSGPLSRSAPARWMEENLNATQVKGSADSFLTLREMVAASAGLAFLPTLIGTGDPRLRERLGIAPRFSVPIWVASHADLHSIPRIVQVSRLLVTKLMQKAETLSGR